MNGSILKNCNFLKAEILANAAFSKILRCCHRVENRLGGRVRTGRGVIQKHFGTEDFSLIETILRSYMLQWLDRAPRITAAWISTSKPGEYHNWHWHVGCSYSVIIYLQDCTHQPGRCGQTVFLTGPNNNLSFFVKPMRGLMLGFNALLPHKTVPILSGIRKTLAIDFQEP